jgi:hypothetical protein
MLTYAKLAGEALLEAKEAVGHGRFKRWIEENCECSYAQSAAYMRVARVTQSKNLQVQTFDGGIRAFLDAHAKPRKVRQVEEESVKPSADDFDHARKLAALRDRGATPNEREVAGRKLARFAQTFNMSADVLETKADEQLSKTTHTQEKTNGNHDENPEQDRLDILFRQWLSRVREQSSGVPRDQLYRALARSLARLELAGEDPLG